MASKIKVLNIGAFDKPHYDSWIYNDVVSFYNIFSQYKNVEIESYYFSYSNYKGYYHPILNLLENAEINGYEAVVYIIHGHGEFENNEYRFGIDGTENSNGNKTKITDSEILGVISKKNIKSFLIVNTCKGIFPKEAGTQIDQYIPPFIRPDQININNALNKIIPTFNSIPNLGDDTDNRFYLESQNIIHLDSSCPLLIFSFSANKITDRNDQFKSYAGSFADMLAVSNSVLTVFDCILIAQLYLQKSHFYYQSKFNVFGTLDKSAMLDIELSFYMIKQDRRNIYRSMGNLMHQDKTKIIRL